jgi:hypothetical protein
MPLVVMGPAGAAAHTCVLPGCTYMLADIAARVPAQHTHMAMTRSCGCYANDAKCCNCAEWGGLYTMPTALVMPVAGQSMGGLLVVHTCLC